MCMASGAVQHCRRNSTASLGVSAVFAPGFDAGRFALPPRPDWISLSAQARAAGVPNAPAAHIGEASEVGGDRALGSPLIGSDISFGFRDLAFQDGNILVRQFVGPRDMAHPEVSDLQGLYGVTVLPELNPVPGDVAIAVSDHVGAVVGTKER